MIKKLLFVCIALFHTSLFAPSLFKQNASSSLDKSYKPSYGQPKKSSSYTTFRLEGLVRLPQDKWIAWVNGTLIESTGKKEVSYKNFILKAHSLRELTVHRKDHPEKQVLWTIGQNLEEVFES